MKELEIKTNVRNFLNIIPLPILVVESNEPSKMIFNDAYVNFRKCSRALNYVRGETIYPLTIKRVSESKSIVVEDFIVRKSTNNFRRVRAYGVPILDKLGKLVRVIELLLEGDMEESEGIEENTLQVFRNILENIGEGIIYYDKDLNIRWLNSSAKSLFENNSRNILTDDMRNLQAREFSNDITGRELFNNISMALQKKSYHEDKIIFGKDNYKLLKSKPVLDEGGNIKGIIQTILDINELKRVEKEKAVLNKQFLHAQKMESIGRLASGISHDYKNILTAIIGLSDLIIMDNELDEETKKDYVKEIKKAAKKAKDITDRLLIFSRKQSGEEELINLNSLILENKMMIQNLIGEDIILKTRLNQDIYNIRMNRAELIQILMNLAVNSRDAIIRGGKLLVETKNTRIETDHTDHDIDIKPGDYVVLTVSDNGMGMNEETKKRIFEPFFTTKEKGVGTGLGLFTVFAIVKKSNGFIDVYSEPGVGTTFKLYFPGVIKNTTKKSDGTDMRKTFKTGSERILLVEDDNDLRRMIQTVLKSIGYSVVSTNSSREALEIIDKGDLKDIDLVLTDVVMPEVYGNELINKAIRRKPGIKFLFISGYTKDIVDYHFSDSDKSFPFISKPFTVVELANKLREVLDSMK